MNRFIGLTLVVGGICLAIIGILVFTGGFNWFGKLPGDIRYESDRTSVYIPLVSMLLVTLALNLVFYVIRKLF